MLLGFEKLLQELTYEKSTWMVTLGSSFGFAKRCNELEARFGLLLVFSYLSVSKCALKVVFTCYKFGEALEQSFSIVIGYYLCFIALALASLTLVVLA